MNAAVNTIKDRQIDTVSQLKQIQADALVMYTKLHNYHWNIKGMQFFPIHEMTEEMYNNFATLYDDAAEMVLQRGEKPYVSMQDIMSVSRIQEDTNTDFDAKYVLQSILADYKAMKEHFIALGKVAEAAQDSTVLAFADENVAKFEKDIWMISASLA